MRAFRLERRVGDMVIAYEGNTPEELWRLSAIDQATQSERDRLFAGKTDKPKSRGELVAAQIAGIYPRPEREARDQCTWAVTIKEPGNDVEFASIEAENKLSRDSIHAILVRVLASIIDAERADAAKEEREACLVALKQAGAIRT